jgi:hypothetical protein
VAQTKSASSGSAARPRRTSAARSGGGKSSAGSRSRSASNGSSAARASAERTASQTSSNGAEAGQGVVGAVGSVVKSAAFPVASAMAGAAAAMALGQRNAKRPKKVLGVSIPGTGGHGTDGLAKNVGEVAKQLARLADEVRTGRQKAEEIGKALR